MTRGRVNQNLLTEKAQSVRKMLAGISTLPLESLDSFLEDPRMSAAGESYLRRALEALLDLGRHLLAKGFGIATTEYKEIAHRLGEVGVLPSEQTERFVQMAGYRNRLVHFYQEVTPKELHEILTQHVSDVEVILDSVLGWAEKNPDRVDPEL